jgi:AcrR family transcriptional regulator
VEQAADQANISRTTAYRYFRNRRALLVAAYPEIEARSLLDDDAPEDPSSRLELVMENLTQQLLHHEPELRAALRLSLELPRPDSEALSLRQGRALAWIEDALAPLRGPLPGEEVHRLALAIRATLGIEPLVWLTDVGGLSREDAAELMRASARTLLRAALADAGR